MKIYADGTGIICNCVNRHLQEVVGYAPAIILIVSYCKVKIFLLLEELLHKIIPYFIIEWMCA